MTQPIISVSGLRGIVGESLHPELAIRFVAAFAAAQPEGPIVVSRDGRTTGEMLTHAVVAGLSAAGRSTIDAGICATPTTGVLVRQLGAAGGVQISASHNPLPYNGIKLFASSGQVLSAEEGQKVLRLFRDSSPVWSTHERVGDIQSCRETTRPHLELVLATVDVERIRRQKFSVLLDSNHGAGSLLGRELLETLGCEVTLLGGTPDGRFSHPPEPTSENLVSVGERVTSCGARLGFCQDPDADRLAVIDEQGRYLGEEYTLALCLDHVLANSSGTVVTNCATSRVCQDLAAKHGCRFLRSAVGEANVVALMQAEQAVFGGEGNGGPIDPRVGYVRDSFVGMATLLDAMAARDQPISLLADALPRYHIEKTKVELDPQHVPDALRRLERHFSQAAADRLDGLRLDWPNQWLLVRPSNTEPIVRVIAEAASRQTAEELCQEAQRAIQQT